MILSKDPESILPPKVKLLYTDLKLISQAHYFKIFSAISKTNSQPFTVRVLDLNSTFYSDNPNLAATLFMQELLRLTALHPNTVIIEDFEIYDKLIVFVTKPYLPLNLLVKENEEGIKNIDVEKLIKDILVDLNFLVFGLGINCKNSSIHIDLDNIYQVSGGEGYILGDWAKGLGNDQLLEFSEHKAKGTDDSRGDKEMQTFAFKILGLSGIKKEDLQDLQDLIGIRNPKTYMVGLDSILSGIPQPDSIKKTLKSMLTKEVDRKLKLRDVVESPCKKIMDKAKVDKNGGGNYKNQPEQNANKGDSSFTDFSSFPVKGGNTQPQNPGNSGRVFGNSGEEHQKPQNAGVDRYRFGSVPISNQNQVGGGADGQPNTGIFPGGQEQQPKPTNPQPGTLLFGTTVGLTVKKHAPTNTVPTMGGSYNPFGGKN